MLTIKTLNKIAQAGLDRIPSNGFRIDPDAADPDAIVVRSQSLHDAELPDSIKSIARAGAGTNNIPVEACTERGIVVFNTPGANANSVKELVLASLFLSSRHIVERITWARSLETDVATRVEKGKSQFTGPEIKGKRISVIGLGAIGVLVANGAAALGLEVIGYDPYISVESAWGLSREVRRASLLDEAVQNVDFITLHLPLNDQTRGIIDAEKIAEMKPGVRILNFARGGLIDRPALIDELGQGQVSRYVTDFPVDELVGVDGVIPIPHLGASTPEAEENCAVMAVDQTVACLTTGNIRNSVNLPDCEMHFTGAHRIVIANRNVPNMVGQITTVLAGDSINISDMINRHREGVAYNIVDIDDAVPEGTIDKLAAIEGVLMVRMIG